MLNSWWRWWWWCCWWWYSKYNVIYINNLFGYLEMYIVYLIFFVIFFFLRIKIQIVSLWSWRAHMMNDGNVTENSGEACVSSMNDECTLTCTCTDPQVCHTFIWRYLRASVVSHLWSSVSWSFAWTLQHSLYWEMEGLTWALALRYLSNVSSITVYCSPKVWDHWKSGIQNLI